ncbi:MAG: redox-sensing transcriptional repressor Rex [Vicinamibacterales bacterium]|nr:redox-sensing transcriptional repressor Rex [Vicinamibacterales bacterium]
MPSETGISQAAMRRLPTYLHLLHRRRDEGAEHISCSDIGRVLDLDPTQIRKDLEITGNVGRPRVGFRVSALIDAIEDFLGWNKVNEALLVGAGNLGTALLGYERLKNYGVRIVAAFDADPARVGTEIFGRRVLPVERLTSLISRMHITIGIITVPAEHAQAVADMMVAGGIRAIWNLAPVSLRVPKHVVVQNDELYYSLAALSRKLADSMKKSQPTGGLNPDASDARAQSVEPV